MILDISFINISRVSSSQPEKIYEIYESEKNYENLWIERKIYEKYKKSMRLWEIHIFWFKRYLRPPGFPPGRKFLDLGALNCHLLHSRAPNFGKLASESRRKMALFLKHSESTFNARRRRNFLWKPGFFVHFWYFFQNLWKSMRKGKIYEKSMRKSKIYENLWNLWDWTPCIWRQQ